MTVRIMKYGVFAVVLVMCVLALMAVKKPNPADIPSPVVKIMGGKGHGSGFYIGNGLIVTAAHVIAEAKDDAVIVKTEWTNLHAGEVLWSNKRRDVALIRIEDDYGLSPAHLSCTTPHRGDFISASGNPTKQEFVTVWGRIAKDVSSYGPWLEVVTTNIATISGQSGGPVFNDRGDVVGMTVGVMVGSAGFGPVGPDRTFVGIGYAVPGKTICGLLGQGQ